MKPDIQELLKTCPACNTEGSLTYWESGEAYNKTKFRVDYIGRIVPDEMHWEKVYDPSSFVNRFIECSAPGCYARIRVDGDMRPSINMIRKMIRESTKQ